MNCGPVKYENTQSNMRWCPVCVALHDGPCEFARLEGVDDWTEPFAPPPPPGRDDLSTIPAPPPPPPGESWSAPIRGKHVKPPSPYVPVTTNGVRHMLAHFMMPISVLVLFWGVLGFVAMTHSPPPPTPRMLATEIDVRELRRALAEELAAINNRIERLEMEVARP